MKRFFLLPALVLFLTFPVLAQVKVGVKAGAMRYAQVYRNVRDSNFKYADFYCFASIFSTIPLSENTYIRLEIVFMPVDLYYELAMPDFGFDTDLRIPVLIGYHPLKKVSVLAGPEFRYSPGRFTGFGSKRFEAGISGGINYQFWKNFSLDATYIHGLTNLRENEEIEMKDASIAPYKGGRSRSIRLGLAYTFGKVNNL